jgi:hypothetical protein
MRIRLSIEEESRDGSHRQGTVFQFLDFWNIAKPPSAFEKYSQRGQVVRALFFSALMYTDTLKFA